jgi:hypothetical protein
MDTNTLVSEMIDDGKRILEQLAQGGFEVTAALWLKKAKNSQWYFYIASPLADDGAAVGYGRLNPLVQQVPDLWIDPIEIRLIGATDPITQEVLAIHSRAPGPKPAPIRWRGNRLGKLDVEAAYLYPLPAMAES